VHRRVESLRVKNIRWNSEHNPLEEEYFFIFKVERTRSIREESRYFVTVISGEGVRVLTLEALCEFIIFHPFVVEEKKFPKS
jgi:hypothetical protein